MPLSDNERKLIHDLALDARELLTNEAREQLEGTYGLYQDGRLDVPANLPQVQNDPETAETYRRLAQFLQDETGAGLPRAEAVDKLVKEVAFTHLNRLVAFKMMEARRLIRGTLDRGLESNAFKFYLAEAEHAGDLALFERGEADSAYRHFLLWQSGQVAQEVRVLFDPDTLASRLFPRPRALNDLLRLLNQKELSSVWQADETIGWVYQFFNEQEKADVFDRLYKQKQKIRRQDIPAATQLFTPNWIVRYLVQNTLGRLWVQMHPDTELAGSELLDYLVPLQGDVPVERLRPVREIRLLDPACGTMHFGLVAFDLFAAMYREELAHAGEPGWPERPSVEHEDEIAAAIVANNLYGIDIDLRAVQLSALALYLKAKSLNKKTVITETHLACADVLPGSSGQLGTFVREMRFTRPIYERLMRGLWERLQDANQIGSLLRLEIELGKLIESERARYAETPLFAGIEGEFEQEAAETEFWHLIEAQIVQGLDAFARQQAAQGNDTRYFTGEAIKGLQLLDVMLNKYDVVVTNPPYSGKRNLNDTVAAYLDAAYPHGKGDLYAAFIQRCSEFLEEGGRLGMITQQSFMFISSYGSLRDDLRESCVIETMAHLGPRAFAEISGEKVNTTAFALHKVSDTTRRQQSLGTYYRLVNVGEGDAKRQAFEQALLNVSNTYYLRQHRFDAIPGSPWVYWVSEAIRGLFEQNRKLEDIAPPKHGRYTGDNFRFLRFWWEVTIQNVAFGCHSRSEALVSGKRWVPYMKGGEYRKWYGNQQHVANWFDDGKEQKAYPGSGERNPEYYFKEGVTWTDLGSIGFSARISPGGYISDATGSCAYPKNTEEIPRLLALMNSEIASYLLGLLNPTLHYQVGDLSRLPVPDLDTATLEMSVGACVSRAKLQSSSDETTYDFITPLPWYFGTERLNELNSQLPVLESMISDKVYERYGISEEDRAAIETELTGGFSVFVDDNMEAQNESNDEPQDANIQDIRILRVESANSWISYAVGIVLGRFRTGVMGTLGCSVFHRSDFAIGSLPLSNETEFDQLVGPPDQFAYVDNDGGRHVFSAEVEQALRDLAVPDGITVLDEGHPRDLPTLVERALILMLGEDAAQEVIAEGAGGNLRKFLERDYFTKWHMKWYRSRPVYWPLQSAKRSYGFVLFHEKISRYTLYILQRDYLDHKLNGLRLQLEDLEAQRATKTGRELRLLERSIDTVQKLVDEVNEFAQTIERIVRAGYEPEENWIDDGVILRMAPLWELVPIWKNEPKKYWERLQVGDFDWAHIAMKYWPERVRAACKSNKSFAIAHGHEEWYQGG